MTPTLLAVLRRLQPRDGYGERQYLPLADIHGRTIKALLSREWIAESEGVDGMRYYLTGRGKKALKVYESPGRRFDGVCCRCGDKPRGRWANGNLKPYCDDCTRTVNNRHYRLKGHQYQSDTLCPRCGERPKHIYPSGFAIGYCLKCRAEMRKEERQRKHARRREMAARGEPMMCIACGKNPIYITGKTTYDYCKTCYQKQQREYRNRKAWEAAMGKLS